MTPTKEPTFGQQCAGLLLAAKRAHAKRGTLLMMTEVAEIIDAVYAARSPKAPEPAIPGNSKPFGDRKHIPPTPEQVTGYSASIGYPLNGHAWCDFYAAKGWQVGKSRMKDWQAAVRNWKTNGWGQGTIALGPSKPPATDTTDYTKF